MAGLEQRWVARKDDEPVAVAATSRELVEELRNRGIRGALIKQEPVARVSGPVDEPPGGWRADSESPPIPGALVTFVYLLLRDHLSAGHVEQLVQNAERAPHPQFSNEHLAAYATELAERLLA